MELEVQLETETLCLWSLGSFWSLKVRGTDRRAGERARSIPAPAGRALGPPPEMGIPSGVATLLLLLGILEADQSPAPKFLLQKERPNSKLEEGQNGDPGIFSSPCLPPSSQAGLPGTLATC